MDDTTRQKHTLVVGGTRGIGRSVVRVLAGTNHLVSVIGRRLPSETDGNHPGVHYWLVDLLDGKGVANACSEIICQYGRINNLVFLQRYRGKGDDWTGEIQVSLTATKNIIENLAGKFAESAENSIVVVSSIAGHFIADEQALSYHVAKAGLNQLVRYYAVALGPKGIRVNSVSPGTILKDESANFYRENPDLQDLYKRITPLGRMGTSNDVANVVAFLCSPSAAFVSGQNIVVDGGLSLIWQETLARYLTLQEPLKVTRETFNAPE